MSRRLDKGISLILHNKGLKLLALLLASVTWFFIRETTSYIEVVRDIPIEVTPPEGWAIEERSAVHVAVSFRGSQADLRALNKEQVRVAVNVPLRNNERTVFIPLGPRQVTAPRTVRAIFVDPPELEVTLDREVEKTVPVELVKAGEPSDGYFVERFAFTPDKVTLYGPEQRLKDVHVVRTMPVDMAGRIRTFTIPQHPLAPPGENWQARMDVDRVSVTFTITERTIRQDFTNIPVNVLVPAGSTRDVSFFPPSVNVALKGRSDVLASLSVGDINAFVNVAMLEDGAVDLPVRISTDANVSVIMIDPDHVRFSVQEEN
ncbi:MAG TPA: CdaR family protein [Kiritimatiellia bacterium]|nr:CdaR family protein [Kiritimatiellia bacterium]HMO98399.1 CdaR family protein [Kiritimatiellia bacterium]HMP96452.1 CdaR family protein [Kiritimatiellia bacterium]